jgi:putrescine transport system substrate-binding protein
MKLRPYITYFHSSQYINDLANGDICVALGWSGDILQAADRASEADNGVEVAYSIPKEGAAMWFDTMAIPKDAKHPGNALLFMNYILRPEVIAAITNYVWYANGNSASTPLVDKEILDDPGIYPPEDVRKKLYTFKVLPPSVDRVYTRTWTRVKTGK